MASVFEAAGGTAGLHRLAEAWHERVIADEIVGHAFSHGFHPRHTERLAAYWAEALGGPTTFTERYGDETTVVRMHSGNGPHGDMDERAVACFDRAMDDVGLSPDGELRQVLHDYFSWATTTTMARYQDSADDVPEGLAIPRWSWNGLEAPGPLEPPPTDGSVEDGTMSRLPFPTRDALDADAQDVWDSITATRGSVVTADGTLAGPFNAWVTAPRMGGRLAELGAALRFESSIERRLLEVAIITVGAHWHSEFEWWAHSRMALQHGVSQEAVDAIARGVTPPLPDDERLVHDVARQLVDDGHVERATYDAARQLLGDRGIVELVTLCGYYTLVSFTLNAFDVALPPGETPTWPADGA